MAITFKLDGKTCTASPGQTILEAALQNGVYIPHLCWHEGLEASGACGMCAVRVAGSDEITYACSATVTAGMEISIRDEMAEKIRKLSCDFIFKTHPADCTDCPKYGKCQLQTISQYVGDTGRNLRENRQLTPADDKNPIILHEMHRCILCGRCVRVCSDVRDVSAIRFEKLNGRLRVVVDGESLADAGCRFCSACVDVCPTGSIREHEAIAAKLEGKSREFSAVPCKAECPAHIDIPRYIRFISLGDYAAAASVVREKAPFPNILGYICTHLCESECKRGHINSPISIRELKKFAAQNAHSAPEHSEVPSTGKKIAVIGAGPAGMTAAYYLTRKGHEVTIFEQSEKAGGMMRYGVPKHRLPRNILDSEISDVLRGITLRTNTKIENAPELLGQGFEAVLASVGAHQGIKLPIPGAQLEGVYVATDFLRMFETASPPQLKGCRIVILGGGNVALDCAAAARKSGASEVNVACIEPHDAMLSSQEEFDIAVSEGVIIHNSMTFVEIYGKNGHVTGMKLAPVSGNEEVSIDADMIIFAVGQRPGIDESFGLALDENGRIAAEKSSAASASGVFAAGDAVTGTVSVIQAIAAARAAAETIDIFLGGDGVIDEILAPAQEKSPQLGKIDGFWELPRRDEDAVCEAGRCLQCDLRLDIAPQRFWTDYASDIGGAT